MTASVDQLLQDSAARPAVLPPLVEPGPPLSRAEIERYSRHLILPDLGDLGQRRLANAKVAVIGAGGLGSPVLTYLAAAGVGTIGVVDFDRVEVSNLQRQTIHGVADIGRPKTASAADTLATINPLVTVLPLDLRLDPDTALATLSGYDLVIDGTDNYATRYLVNDACALLGIPYVWGSVYRFEGQVSVFWAAHGPQYRELFPAPPPADSVVSCGEGGVLGVVCSVIGSVMATEAIKLLCGIGRPLVGRVLVYDALTMSFRMVNVRKDPAAQPITGLDDYEAFCSPTPVVANTGPAGHQAGAAASGGHPPTDGALQPVSPAELAGWQAAGVPVTVIDVRVPAEFGLGGVPGAMLIPMGQLTDDDAMQLLRQASEAGELVLYCKSGARSARAARTLRAAGLCGVRELAGGILAWASDVDPTLPRY